MVEAVVADFDLIIKELAETVKVAQDHEDEVTADLLIGMSASLQKHNWMLNAYLK